MGKRTLVLVDSEADRAEVCMDACEGMPDPVAGVAGLRDAARFALKGLSSGDIRGFRPEQERLKAALDAAGG